MNRSGRTHAVRRVARAAVTRELFADLGRPDDSGGWRLDTAVIGNHALVIGGTRLPRPVANRDWSNEFVWGLGLGGGFAYLRIKVADPPRQMYTGNATPRQHRYLAELLGAQLAEGENRAFQSSWPRVCEFLDAGRPPVLGPLDMFHLRFYDDIYHRRHIPIHFLLLVGYDDTSARFLDAGQAETQSLPLDELRQAWDVNVHGLGKKNRWAALDLAAAIPPDRELIVTSITDQAQMMLQPPVSMPGIPAMRKLAREIADWP